MEAVAQLVLIAHRQLLAHYCSIVVNWSLAAATVVASIVCSDAIDFEFTVLREVLTALIFVSRSTYPARTVDPFFVQVLGSLLKI